MLFIVLHHLTINNIGLSAIETHIDPSLTSQYLGTSFLDCFFIIGVNVFFLLSGYFGIKLKLGKIFRLLFKLYVFWILSALYLFTADFQLFASVDYHKRADADGNGTYDKSRNYNQHAESVSQFAESRDESVFQHYY